MKNSLAPSAKSNSKISKAKEMDFHALSRKDLQTLCKKNNIRANMTNAAMADALQALELVEGIEDIVLDPMTESVADVSQQSPTAEPLRSVNVPPTGGRTSTRRKPINESALKEPEQTTIPSSVKTRRGMAAKESNVRRKICEEEDEETDDNGSEVPKTPATRNGRKRTTGASARRGVESQDRDAKEENEKPVDVGLRTYSTRRSTRLSGKSLQEAPPTITKSRRRKEAVKIMALSEESEKEPNDGAEKSDVQNEGETGASAEHVCKDLDQDPTAAGADAAPVIPREDSPDFGDVAVAAVLESPPPTEGFNQGDQESIEEDLGLPKTALKSQEYEENPTESSKIENKEVVIAVEAASDGNQENVEASPHPHPPAVLSDAEIDGSELDTIAITAADGRADNLNSIIEGGNSCEAAEEIPMRKEWEDDDEGGDDTDQGMRNSITDQGMLPVSIVDKVPEDDGVIVRLQQAEDANLESLALRLQQNLTLKGNPDVEEEGTEDDGKSSKAIKGCLIPVPEVCDKDAAERDIGLKASAEESDESDCDAEESEESDVGLKASAEEYEESDVGLKASAEESEESDVDAGTLAEQDIGLKASAEESEESDGDSEESEESDVDAGLHLGAENTLDFSSDVLPLEDTTDGDDLSPPCQAEGGSSSAEETETNISFGEIETAPTTDNGADQSFSANPDHLPEVFNHVVLCRTPVNQRSNVVGGASDPCKVSGSKSNKTLSLSLSNKKTATKSRIFEDTNKENNKNDGTESARKEGREYGSSRKVKKTALVEDVNKGEDSRQKSLKKKSMGQLKRMVKEKISEMNNKESLDKRFPLQALSENCLSRSEDK